jgi:signal peptidase I
MAAATEPPAPRTAVSRLWLALGISGVAIAANQLYEFLSSLARLTSTESYLGTLLVPGILLLLLLGASRWERRPLRDFGFFLSGPWTTLVAFASLLSLLYFVLRLDPGFIFGFGRVIPLAPPLFGYFLLSGPFLALAEVSLFFGYAFRTFARALPLRSSVLLSAALLAGYSTNGSVFRILSAEGAVQYVFTTTLVSFVLGMVLALYCYKTQWSILGPVTLLSVILTATPLLPVGALFPSWEVNFASSLIAYAALLVVVAIGIQEPRLQALRYLGTRIGPRRYRYRDRARDRAALRGTLLGLVTVGLVFLTVSYGLPAATGTPRPFLAIATGSMVPTFHPGEFVVIEHVAPAAIHVGTIIAFSVSCLPSPTVHRVIRIVSTAPNWVYQTKGDANPVQDPCTVPYSHVLGAVAFYVPYLGLLILDPLFAGSVIVVILMVPLLWRGGRR